MTKLIDELAADLPEEPGSADSDRDATSDLQAVADVLRSQRALRRVAHENPDGERSARSSATTLGLRALGKDVVMYLSGAAPLPAEYGFLQLSELRRDLPADIE